MHQAGVPLLFKVKLGPIAAQFKGRGRLEHDEAAQAGSFTGSAVDGKTSSRIKGAARFTMSPDAGPERSRGNTRIAVTVEFTITGALAQFSREGIVRALAEQLSRQFADNLQQRLPQAGSPATQAVAHESARCVDASTAASASAQPPARSAMRRRCRTPHLRNRRRVQRHGSRRPGLPPPPSRRSISGSCSRAG